MTANIDPLQPQATVSAQATGKSPAAAGKGPGSFAAALDGAQQNAPADTLPQSPPPELGAHIAEAARAWEALAASGRHVSFSSSPGGRTQIELSGDHGSNSVMSAGELFALIEREGAT